MRSVRIDTWQHFVPLLAEAVSHSCDIHPTVRVWKETELISLINNIVRANRSTLKSTFPPGREVLEQMERTGWLRRLPLENNSTGRVLYLLDQEAANDEIVDPLEVLQAMLPSGVISYFGAIGYYELTSQTPTFFHIGRLVGGYPVESNVPAEGVDRNPLGTVLFEFDGVHCYETKRYRSLVPGVQMRVISSRTWYRVTTLEQTLLDAILQPVRCGGEAVVFEAWEHAANRADFDRMAEHLQAINRDSLFRRVGAMLEMTGVAVNDSSSLGKLLNAVKGEIDSSREMISLLPGLKYTRTSGAFGVFIP